MTELVVGDRVRYHASYEDATVGTVVNLLSEHVEVDWDNGITTRPPFQWVTRITPDWNEPLEAYHPDGRVVAVEVARQFVGGMRNVLPVLDGFYNTFESDGLHDHSEWRIRNRVVRSMCDMGITGMVETDATFEGSDERWAIPTPTVAGVQPDVVERMMRLCRKIVDHGGGYAHTLRDATDIVAALPVDPLLVRARKICQRQRASAVEYLSGDYDDTDAMRATLAALRESVS